MTAYDTPEQIAAFDVYIKQNPDGRQVHHTGTLGYEEDEWSAFQSGWNAAAQAEREACAKVCDETMREHDPFDRQAYTARTCAEYIRARGIHD